MPHRLIAPLLVAALAHAGGGPETTLVVVNARSPVSRIVANEYMKLRDIPASHVVYVDGIPHLGVVSLEFFRETIWKPIRAHLERVGPVDLVTYSADFPYGVRFAKAAQPVGGVAALTGVTYLMPMVEAEEEFWQPQTNPYVRIKLPGGGARRAGGRRATSEERALYMRANAALQKKRYEEAAEAFGKVLQTLKGWPEPWYNYACCLALLGKRKEALDALEKAVEAGYGNAAHARQDPDFASLRNDARFSELLSRMGSGAGIEVLASKAFDLGGRYLSTQLAYTGFKGNSLPEVLAYLQATAKADGTHPNGTVYICRNKNVRSTTREPFFGLLRKGLEKRGRKVELIEGVLPSGKADVIGAVVGSASFSWPKSKSRMLPGAICEHLTSFGAHFGTPGQTKLTEFMRYGAAGSSGTVMEPLALHWKFPNPTIHLFYADGCSLAEAFYQSVFGPYQLMVAGDGLARPFATFQKVSVRAPASPWKGSVELAPKGEAERFELWVDGRRVEGLALDTAEFDDGHHDVRVVGVSGPVGTRSYEKIDAVFANHGHTASVEVAGDSVEVKASGAKETLLLDGLRPVSNPLPPGRHRIVPRVVFADGKAWRGAPVDVDVPYPRLEGAPERIRAGLLGEIDGKPLVVTDLAEKAFAAKRARRVTLRGFFEAPADGFFQLTLTGAGSVSVDGLCEKESLDRQVCLGVDLRKGWNPIAIDFEPKGSGKLAVMLAGGQVYGPLGMLCHVPPPPLKRQPTFEGDLKGGLIVKWKRAESRIGSITITAQSGKADGFVVEATTARRFKEVKGVTVVNAPGAFVQIRFEKPLRAKQIRIRAEGDLKVAGVEAGQAEKKRR